MGIQDRDYVRERRLRWDERPGEMRLEDEEPRRRGLNFQWRPGRWVMLAVAVAVIGLYGANHWMSRNTLPVANDVGGGSSPDTAADVPAVPVEQGPENPVLIGTVT